MNGKEKSIKHSKDDWIYIGVAIRFVACIVGYQQYTGKEWMVVLEGLMWLKDFMTGPIVHAS